MIIDLDDRGQSLTLSNGIYFILLPPLWSSACGTSEGSPLCRATALTLKSSITLNDRGAIHSLRNFEASFVWALQQECGVLVSPLRGCTLNLSLTVLFFSFFFVRPESVFSLLRPLCWTTVCIAGDGCSDATFFVSSCWFLKFTAAHVTIVNNCNNNKK